MKKIYHIEAQWDPEAQVWVSHSDVPGLVIETATLAEFEALVYELAPEVIADNGSNEGPASIEWSSRRTFDVAAA